MHAFGAILVPVSSDFRLVLRMAAHDVLWVSSVFQISDTTSKWPHMMPSAQLFSEHVGALGISRDSHVVVYDGKGQFSSARAW